MIVVASVTLAAGCANTHVVEMDPMVFEVVTDGRDVAVEHLDATALFEEGNRAFEALDYATAARKYRLVHERFPDSRYALVSAYNAGLALERDARCGEAIELYGAVAVATAGTKDAQDALFRMAACAQTLDDWARARDLCDRILEPHFERISVVDRIAALAHRGLAQHRLGALALAERDFKAALAMHLDNLDNRTLAKSPDVSMAQFQIGEIYRDLFASIRFRLPTERMARDLEDKSNFFLMAQSAYLKALRLQHPDWAVVAGYQLGTLYEVMYDDMMAAEIPGELTREEVELYYDELREKIRPLLVRAIDIYERNLRMGQRFGATNEWVQRTEASLARLKDALRQDSSREAEAQLRRAN